MLHWIKEKCGEMVTDFNGNYSVLKSNSWIMLSQVKHPSLTDELEDLKSYTNFAFEPLSLPAMLIYSLPAVYIIKASSTLIRFQTKTELFCSGYGYRPHYNAENDHRKRSH